MNEFENDISRVRLKYQTGQIDQETYFAELKRLSEIEEEKNNPDTSKKKTKGALFVIIKELWLPILVIIAVVMYCISITAPQEFENVDSLGNLPDPIQSDLLGGKVVKTALGKNVDIIYGAEYTIYGRVVTAKTFAPMNVRDALSPMDLGLTWGFLAQDEYDDAVIFTALPSRFLRFETNRLSKFNEVGGLSGMGKKLSNNHIIPKDKKIERLIKKVKVDDFIKLEGFLVTATPQGSNTPVLKSSAVRYDGGAGACEVMYVTSIKWLKEK